MRIKDENIHRIQPAKRLNRGAACIATGCANDSDTIPTTVKRHLKQLPDQLHCEIFERKGWTMEKFQQEMVVIQLHHRRARRVAKVCIGLGDNVREFRICKCIPNKGAHDLKRDLFIGFARHCGDIRMRQRWHSFRNIKPPITCQAREHRFFEAKDRCIAAG